MRLSLAFPAFVGLVGLTVCAGNGCTSDRTGKAVDSGPVSNDSGSGGSPNGGAGPGGGGASGGSGGCGRCDAGAASPDTSIGGSGGAGGRGGAGGVAPDGTSGGVGDSGSDGVTGPSCVGATPPPAGRPLCRTVSDCPAGYNACRQEVLSTGGGCGGAYCGGINTPPHDCGVDSDCGAGRVCVSATAPCCPQPGKACVAACTATSCPADQRCNATGRCEIVPCTDGFACASGLTCAPARADADAHGCAPVRCTEGYTCPSDARCGTDAGHADGHGCAPISCTEGYTCPGNLACLPTASMPDSHGCAVVTCDGVSCAVNETCQLTYGVSATCTIKGCATDGDCDCGVCTQDKPGYVKRCAPRMSVCLFEGEGGAQGAMGGYYGGGGVTGTGGVRDSGAGGAGGSVDGGGNG